MIGGYVPRRRKRLLYGERGQSPFQFQITQSDFNAKYFFISLLKSKLQPSNH